MGGMDSRRLLYCGAPLPPPPAIHLPLLTRLSVARSISATPCQLLFPVPVLSANPTRANSRCSTSLSTSSPGTIGFMSDCRFLLLRTFELGTECGRLVSRCGSGPCESMSQMCGPDRQVAVSTNQISREGQAVPTKAGDRERAMHRWQQRPDSARKRRTWRL